uniref:Uncharacterized protein n=1 Tax=Tanacetum cinerariifolium TaxID=118510 RepID=A0A6L2JEV0_TANCI|nr:hypothetical protein [Tanacetum cinerariifolium]
MTGGDNRDGNQPETSNPTPPIPSPTQQIPHTVSSIKLSILKKGEYDIWAMKMKHYLSHTDYPIWQVIQNGYVHVSITTDTNGMIKVLPPKTAEEICSNDESKKMQKYLLKQQFKGFSMSASEGLHKGYDRFPTLLSQLEIHGAGVSHEDANQKFLSTPASSSSNTHNVAFVSVDNTSSTNDVSTAYSVSSPSVLKSHKEGSSLYTDEVIHSFFANQSSAPQLDCDDLEKINDDDLEEMDLKWQVAMISIRIKKFHKRTCKKLQFDTRDPDGFDKTKLECFNCHKIGHFARDYKVKGIKTAEEEMLGIIESKLEIMAEELHIRMIQNLWLPWMERLLTGSDNKVKSCSKTCAESYARLKKLYDEQRDKLGDASVEITAYTLALKECDLEDTPVNDRYAEGMHGVPPPITGDYMPSGPNVEIDYSKFTYVPKQTLADESNSKPIEYASSESDSSLETTTSMPAPVDTSLKIVCEPKVWTDAPIIEEYELDCDDDSVSNVQENIEKPSFDFTDSVKHVKSPREKIKEKDTPNHFLITNQVDDLSSHTTKYTSLTLTQKVFAIIRRIGKGFLGVETPLFATMLVQPQAAVEEEEEWDESHKVAALEQDKVTQALEILKLKRRVKNLEKKRRSKRMHPNRRRIKAIDADEEITLVDMVTHDYLGAELQERLEEKDEVNAGAKEVNAAKPTVFDDEEDTPTDDPKEMSEEDVQNMLQIVPVSEVGGITQAYQSFEDMLKDFDMEDLDAL